MPHTHSAQPVSMRTAPALVLACAALAAAFLAGCAGSRLAPPAANKPESHIVVESRSQSGLSGGLGDDPLSGLRARVAFEFDTPAWVPPGFQPIDALSLPTDASWVLLSWEHDAGNRIDLVISPHRPSLPDTPAQVVKSVSVNGQPGQLVLGLCREASEGWDPTLQTILAWQSGEVHYALATTGAAATAYDLLRMAGSMY